jgi:transcriptional/translational regulatory protein YebC/TACO1
MGRAFEYRRASKEKRWDKMSRIFPKLAKAITMAAKEGGQDPEMNASLRSAIQNAKGQNMPKDNIESAIKRAAGKDAADYTEINYEGKGPHGVLVFVECASDNTTRTIANVRHYFTKQGGFQFPKTEEQIDLEELELELIDAGLEEIEETDEDIYLYADYTNFGIMSSALEAKGIEVAKANLQRIPNAPVEFTEEHLEDIEKMLDKMEEDDDVQQVFTNIA